MQMPETGESCVRFCSLVSGSTGNALLTASAGAALLIDAGLSYKKLNEKLASFSLCPQELSGILITHEHTDHTAALGMLLRHTDVPVYMTSGTFTALCGGKLQQLLEKADADGRIRIVSPLQPFQAGCFSVCPIPVSHDAAEPVAYRLEAGGIRLAVVSDLGCFDASLTAQLQKLDFAYLEANHDPNILEVGPYPYPLKLRIAGEKGHLSNEACGRLLADIYHPGLHRVMLGHLSRENNIPELAVAAVRSEMVQAGISDFDACIRLSAAPADDISETIVLTKNNESQS